MKKRWDEKKYNFFYYFKWFKLKKNLMMIMFAIIWRYSRFYGVTKKNPVRNKISYGYNLCIFFSILNIWDFIIDTKYQNRVQKTTRFILTVIATTATTTNKQTNYLYHLCVFCVYKVLPI